MRWWLILALAAGLAGCTQQVEHRPFTNLGEQCETTKVRPDWYTAEVMTRCRHADGKIEAIATNHTDPSVFAVFGGIVGAVIGVAL